MKVYKYGDNVDTDVIIPARYLNAPDEKSLASHCSIFSYLFFRPCKACYTRNKQMLAPCDFVPS